MNLSRSLLNKKGLKGTLRRKQSLDSGSSNLKSFNIERKFSALIDEIKPNPKEKEKLVISESSSSDEEGYNSDEFFEAKYNKPYDYEFSSS